MQKKLIWCGVVALLFCGSLNADAGLMSAGDSWVYDGDNDVYWRKNLNEFTYLSYEDQISAINLLTPQGTIGQGRMANQQDIRDLLTKYTASTIALWFFPSVTAGGYWDGRIDTQPENNTAQHYNFGMELKTDGFYYGNGIKLEGLSPSFNSWWTVTDADDTRGGLGAWVIADNMQGPNPVPEPASMILFGTGIAGLIGATRRKKKD